jgi:hypothetical protein
VQSILPHQRPSEDHRLVIGLDGLDLSDLTTEQLASVICAANAAAADAVLRIWERTSERTAEESAAEGARLGRPTPFPARPLAPATAAVTRRRNARIMTFFVVTSGLWLAAAVLVARAVCS